MKKTKTKQAAKKVLEAVEIQKEVKFVLRIPAHLHKRVKEAAQTEHLSMNTLLTRLIDNAIHPKYSLPHLISRMEKKGLI